MSRDTLNLTFRELAMTMVKLKLDMPLKDFYRFGVSLSTASLVFSLWKVALDIRFSPDW